MIKTVGRFSIEGETFSGPAEYMKQQGNAKLDKILAGKDVVFNMCCDKSPDIETAILVSMQTDYAGWIGAQQLINDLTHRAADQSGS